MSRAKTKRAAKKPQPVLTLHAVSTLEVVERRLQRVCDLMSCIDHCQEAELTVGSLAIVARDVIDSVIADLTPLRLSIEKAARS